MIPFFFLILPRQLYEYEGNPFKRNVQFTIPVSDALDGGHSFVFFVVGSYLSAIFSEKTTEMGVGRDRKTDANQCGV